MKLLNDGIEALAARKPDVCDIVKYPSSVLTKISTSVIPGLNLSSEDLVNLLADMTATLQYNEAAGLAAIQIGVPLCVLVVQDASRQPVKMVNPTILERDGGVFEMEGCLSLPGTFLRVRRDEEIVVSYFDEKLEPHKSVFTGLLSRAIQHEMDHLEGKTFLDVVSSVERSNALRKMKIRSRRTK